jgi:hypothetical protein
MLSGPNADGSPESGILLIGHGAGNWFVTLPDLGLSEPDPTGAGSTAAPSAPQAAAAATTPLTEAKLARALSGSDWPSEDAEFSADMDELWALVRSSTSGKLNTRVRRFSILQADPSLRPHWWRLAAWLVLIWAAGATLLWQMGSESPSDRAIAEAIAAERSRLKAIARKVLPNDRPRPMTDSYVRHGGRPRATWPDAALDYRTPVPGGESVDLVLRELVRARSLDLTGAVVKLAIGLPLCLLGPLFVAVLAEPLVLRWGGGLLPSFGTIFLILAAVLVPLLLWLERRTRGEYFADVMREEARTAADSCDDQFQRRDTGLAWAFFTEIALLGPRLVWTFIDWLRGRPHGDAPTRAAAAQIACELFEHGEGLPLPALVRPDRPRAQVAAAVKHLLACDWVGVSSNRDRVWLSSRVNARLAEVLGGNQQGNPLARASHGSGAR